jgi:hypothetical protein
MSEEKSSVKRRDFVKKTSALLGIAAFSATGAKAFSLTNPGREKKTKDI